MTLALDSRTPLMLVSELTGRLNVNPAQVPTRLLPEIIENSQLFQAACRRRFDEYIETRYYTPFAIAQGGDLFGLRELRLDADLKPYTNVDGVLLAQTYTIVNGDASTINNGNVKLEPLNSPYKSIVRLNPYGIQFWYHAGVTDPKGSISITGTWGFGGRWISTGATLSTDMNGSVATLVSSVALEAGMVLLVDSEYLYVSSTSGTNNTVERAFNGSTAASHTHGATIYRWLANETVHRCFARLYQVALEQNKSPLFGQIVIGDVSFPTQVDSWPKDVLSSARTAGMIRPPRMQSI